MFLVFFVYQSADHIIFLECLELKIFFLMIELFHFKGQSRLDDFGMMFLEFYVVFVFSEFIFSFIIVPDCNDNFGVQLIF